MVPAHLTDHQKAVEEPVDDWPKVDGILLHNHVHVRTGSFGFPGVTMQLGMEGVDKVSGKKETFVCEGTIRDMLHMAQLIRRTGLQVPKGLW